MQSLEDFQYVVCPDCWGQLSLSQRHKNGEREHQAVLECAACFKGFPIIDRVLRCAVLKEHGRTGSSYGFVWKGFWRGMFDRKNVFGLSFEDAGSYFLGSLGLEKSDLKNLKVLDAGTGSGRIPFAIAGWGCDVYAVDVHESLPVIAEQFTQWPRVRFIQADLMKLPFKDQVFDIVWSSGVLMITADPRGAFQTLVKRVKPGGRLFVSLYSKDFHHYRLFRKLLPFAHRLPPIVNYAIAGLVSIPLYTIFNGTLWMVRRKRSSPPYTWFGYTFEDAEHKSYLSILLNVFDQLVPTFQREYSVPEVLEWFNSSGFHNVTVTERIGMTAVRGVKD